MAATRKWTMAFHSGETPQIVKGLITASQGVLIPGAPMYLSQSGTWKVCVTSMGTDAWHGFLVGRVASPGTWPLTAELDGSAGIYVALIKANHIYSVYCNAAGTDSVAAQTDVGDNLGLTVSATSGEVGFTTLDTDNANETVKVVNIASNQDTTGRKYTTTDSPGVLRVSFLQSVIDTDKA